MNFFKTTLFWILFTIRPLFHLKVIRIYFPFLIFYEHQGGWQKISRNKLSYSIFAQISIWVMIAGYLFIPLFICALLHWRKPAIYYRINKPVCFLDHRGAQEPDEGCAHPEVCPEFRCFCLLTSRPGGWQPRSCPEILVVSGWCSGGVRVVSGCRAGLGFPCPLSWPDRVGVSAGASAIVCAGVCAIVIVSKSR